MRVGRMSAEPCFHQKLLLGGRGWTGGTVQKAILGSGGREGRATHKAREWSDNQCDVLHDDKL